MKVELIAIILLVQYDISHRNTERVIDVATLTPWVRPSGEKTGVVCRYRGQLHVARF